MEIRAINRATAILTCIGSDESGLSLSRISEAVGLSKATTYRFLQSLSAVDFVRADPNGGRYLLGKGLLRLARLSTPHEELKSLARKSLMALQGRTNETVALVVVQDRERLTIDVALSQQELRAVPDIGGTKPIHAGAAGKAILSTYSKEVLEQTLADYRLVAVTSGTIVDLAALRRDLVRTRARGYAVSIEETVRGEAASAAAIVGPDGTAAGAINICGPTVRMSRNKLSEYGKWAAAAAEELSAKLAAAWVTRGPSSARANLNDIRPKM